MNGRFMARQAMVCHGAGTKAGFTSYHPEETAMKTIGIALAMAAEISAQVPTDKTKPTPKKENATNSGAVKSPATVLKKAPGKVGFST